MRSQNMANFKVVVFDETEYWSPEIVEKAGGKIYASYLFDSSSVTHCCELTPSYYLHHLFSTPLHDTDDGDVGDEIRTAEAGCDNDGYYHCRGIDRNLDKTLVFDFGLQQVGGETGQTREDLLNKYIEECHANCGGLQFPPATSFPKAA